jgi:hypothetical protein
LDPSRAGTPGERSACESAGRRQGKIALPIRRIAKHGQPIGCACKAHRHQLAIRLRGYISYSLNIAVQGDAIVVKSGEGAI